MLIFDGHLDLSLNAQELNRDLTRPIGEIRQREHGLTDKPDRGNGTVCLPEMRRGQVGICVATQISRFVKSGNPLPGWKSPAQAWAHTQGQLAWYRAMEDGGQMVQIRDAAALHRHVQLWENNPSPHAPIGYILSLEGADSIITPKHLERAYAQGLRAVGPAHYGPGTYAYGTDAADMIPGAKLDASTAADVNRGLGPRGRDLLSEMERLGVILDVTHLSDQSFWEALDHFGGHVWASHSNCRVLVPHHRQLNDDQIKALIARGAVIGGCLDAWMLVPGWIAGQSRPQSTGVLLRHLVDHIDHICQLAGNAHHCGLGTDLDGEFGREQSPSDLDTIADLQKLPTLLSARGFKPEDISAITSGNFVRFLNQAWSASHQT